LGTVANGKADAVEDQALGRQGLGLSEAAFLLLINKTGVHPGACFVSA
jgi:hypothetical protein